MTIVRRALTLSTLAVALAAGGGAVAHAGSGPAPYAPGFEPKDEAAARQLRLERQAIDLINAAANHVHATVPGCKPKSPDLGSSKPTHDAPSQAILDVLAPLRRPATPAELAAANRRIGFGGETYVDYIRTVKTAGGHPLTIVVARRQQVLFRLPSRCFAAEHARLVHLLRGKPRKLRSTALETFSHIRQGQEANNDAPTTPVDGIYLFDRGGGGGGADVASFRERGVFTSLGRDSRSRLSGLVPDGVASVTLEYPRRVPRGKYFKPTVYPSAFTKTVQVHDNVLSLAIPRGAPDAFPHRMVWRDASGAVVHTYTEAAF